MMTREEIIQKILRPNGVDLLIPHKKQIEDCGREWLNTYEDSLNFCTFGFRTKNGVEYVDSRTDPKSYIRALLQPIPNFSTAMQFLENGAVVVFDKRLLCKHDAGVILFYLESENGFEWFTFDDVSFSLSELISWDAMYAPWIDRETGETNQEIKDFCYDILK